MKIKTGDLIEILSGKDRLKRGKVLSVNAKADRLVVEGLNLRKRHSRPRRAGEKGQIVEFPASLPLSRVALVCPNCQKAVRVGFRVTVGGEQGSKERWCRKCQTTIAKV